MSSGQSVAQRFVRKLFQAIGRCVQHAGARELTAAMCRALPGVRNRWAGMLLMGLVAVFSPASHAHNLMGANLNGIADYNRNHEFVDVVKQSRRFLRIGQFDDGDAGNLATIGADGWPVSDFRLFAMAAQQNTLGLAGDYTVLFSGRATLSTSGGGAGSFTSQTYDAASNTTRAVLSYPAGQENFMVDFRDTQASASAALGSGIKNLHVIRPGYNAEAPPTFTTPYLDHVRRFSVLRFMDWMQTNTAKSVVTWADRTTPDKLKTEAQRARWETAIELANTVGRDLWVNVPVNANDDYVLQLATLLRDTVAPTLNVYVEYSNEVWNFSFEQAGINADLARAEVAANASSKLKFDGSQDANGWAMRRVAQRLVQISDIFKSVWGASAINTRVRPVLAGQMANSFHVSEGLRLIDEGLARKPDSVIYAISGAPYIFAAAVPDANADETPGLTSAQILDGMAAGVANAPSQTDAYQYLSHAALAAWYGVKVLGYEGGFDNFGGGNIAAKRAANLDARIRTLCASYLNAWYSHGFEQFMWFSAGAASYDTPFGMWPLLEDMAQPDVPKNQCMDDALAAGKPVVTLGSPVGASVPGGAWSGNPAFAGSPTAPLTGLAGPFGFPGYVEFLLRADVAGSYTLKARGTAPAGEKFRVSVNNALANDAVTLPLTTGDSSAMTVKLRKGVNAMRIARNLGGSWSVSSFSFTLAQADAVPASFGANTAGSSSALRLSAVVEVASADRGKTGQLWVVAALPGGDLFCLTPALWSPCGSSIPSALSTTLGEHSLTLLTGQDVRALAGTAFYAGYGTDLSDMLAQGKFGLIYQIR